MVVSAISTVLSMQAWACMLRPERGVGCRSHDMIIEWLLLLYDGIKCKTVHSSSSKRGSRAASSTAYHSRWKAVQKQAAQKQAAQGATAMQQDACSACVGAANHAATCSDQQGSHRMGTQRLSPVPVGPVTSQVGTHIRRWRCGIATSY